MKRKLIAILILCLASTTSQASDNILDSLDFYLSCASRYDRQKEKSIGQLHRKMTKARNDEARYQTYTDLYTAYSSYKYDSASVYADKSLMVARRMKNTDYIVMAECNKVFCLLSAGLYKEAFDEMNTINISHASKKARERYYFTHWRLLADISDYNHAKPYQQAYITEARQLVDSMKTLMDNNSVKWNYIEGLQLLKEYKYDDCIRSFMKIINSKKLYLHERAIVMSILGWIYKSRGNDKLGLHYLAEAAICDIKSSTKETTALREVGALVFEKGDFNRATVYVQKALDDANFYDARQRKIEIGNILPIIQQDRYNVVKKQRNTMLLAVAIVSLLLIGLFISLYFLRRQMRKLQEARTTIEERNRELEKRYSQLQEANKIKTEYIGKSFFINAGYIDKVEKLYRTIDRKITARQYDDLRRSLKESTLIAERKSMYADFDETFLTLFPHFIEKFNDLFEKADQKIPSSKQSLTTEMRIFALIRLGINDAERIAQFLNYSVNTINTYKTRVKNKSLADNDKFEQKIMEI
jgi:type II secretory pathway pseudopilin PulG